MSPPRDSLRDVLGSHLERAEADAEAERKARAMVDRDALRDRLDAVRGLPSEDATRDAATSERREHAVVTAPSAAEPRRDTARKIKIDPRIDPRLLETERHEPPPATARSRARLLAVAACVAVLLVIGVVLAATRGDGREADVGARLAPAQGARPSPTRAAATTDAIAEPGSTGGDTGAPDPSSSHAHAPSATPTAGPGAGAPSAAPSSTAPSAKPDATTTTPRATSPSQPAAPPRAPSTGSPTTSVGAGAKSPPPPPPPASALKPLGGAGPTY